MVKHQYPPWYKEKMAYLFPDENHIVRKAVKKGVGLKSALRKSMKESSLPEKRHFSLIKEVEIIHTVY